MSLERAAKLAAARAARAQARVERKMEIGTRDQEDDEADGDQNSEEFEEQPTTDHAAAGGAMRQGRPKKTQSPRTLVAASVHMEATLPNTPCAASEPVVSCSSSAVEMDTSISSEHPVIQVIEQSFMDTS